MFFLIVSDEERLDMNYLRFCFNKNSLDQSLYSVSDSYLRLRLLTGCLYHQLTYLRLRLLTGCLYHQLTYLRLRLLTGCLYHQLTYLRLRLLTGCLYHQLTYFLSIHFSFFFCFVSAYPDFSFFFS